MVDTHNLFSILLWERKIKFTPQVNTFSPGLFPLLLAMTRLPERHLNSIISIPKAVSLLYTMIDSGKMLNKRPLLISHIINRINTNLLVKDKKMDSYLIECRTNANDAWNMYNALSETKVPISNKNLINLYDPKGLKEIADKYFDQNNKLDITVF